MKRWLLCLLFLPTMALAVTEDTVTMCPGGGCDYATWGELASALHVVGDLDDYVLNCNYVIENVNLTVLIQEGTGWSGANRQNVDITFDGATTSATCGIKYVADGNMRFDGVYADAKVTWEHNGNAEPKIYDDYITFEGLVFLHTASLSESFLLRYAMTGLVIRDCYIGLLPGTTRAASGINGTVFWHYDALQTDVTFVNNVVYELGMWFEYDGDPTYYIYNNLFVWQSDEDGILFQFTPPSGEIVPWYVNNNIFIIARDYRPAVANITDDTLLSWDNNATNGDEDSAWYWVDDPRSFLNNVEFAVMTFTDSTAGDWHITADADSLIDMGKSLASDPFYPFDHDIELEEITGTWDIGPDYYVAPASADTPNRRRKVIMQQ